MAKELADFDFSASPVNEPLVRELATGAFLEGKRNVVLVGSTGTGKSSPRGGDHARVHLKRDPGALLRRRGAGQPP